MAQFVKNGIVLAILAGCMTLCGLSIVARAESLPDPTRPAPLSAQDGTSGEESGPILQSVLISPGRRIAIISGQTVSLGGRFGTARVMKITENEVVLRSGDGFQTLKLFPNIEKRLMPNRGQQNSDLRK